MFYFQNRLHFSISPFSDFCFPLFLCLKEVVLSGMAARSFLVYASVGFRKISSTIPCSTAFP